MSEKPKGPEGLAAFQKYVKCDRLGNTMSQDQEKIRSSGVFEGRGYLQKKPGYKDLEHGIDNHNIALWQACTRGDIRSVKWALMSKKLLVWKRVDSGLRKVGHTNPLNPNSGHWEVIQVNLPINDPDRSPNARYYDPQFSFLSGCTAAHQAAGNKADPRWNREILDVLIANGWNMLQQNDLRLSPETVFNETEFHRIDGKVEGNLHKFS